MANKIKALQKSGAKKLILDLRNCAEGDEAEGIATANLFLNHGTITYLQGQKYPREAFNADPSKAITTLPVVVLVNKAHGGTGGTWRLPFLKMPAATLWATRPLAMVRFRRPWSFPMGRL